MNGVHPLLDCRYNVITSRIYQNVNSKSDFSKLEIFVDLVDGQAHESFRFIFIINLFFQQIPITICVKVTLCGQVALFLGFHI